MEEPPFWLQPSSPSPYPATSNGRRRLSRASSFLLNSSTVLIVLLVIILCFILIVVPKFTEFVSQMFRPQSVKKSWDSLNLILVFFAIVCGFLSRNTNEDKSENGSVSSKQTVKSNPSTPHRWYEYSDDRNTNPTINRLRSSSSYPDLRLQESPWITSDERWRSYDDTHVPNHRFLNSDQLRHRREASPELEPDRSEIHGEASSPPRSPSPPPTPPHPAKTPKVVKRKVKQSQLIHRPGKEVDYQKNVVSELADFERIQLPPLSPLSPPSFYQESEQKNSKNEKKRGGATKEFLTSLRRKKKKQRQKSIESFETIINASSTPPPPPPLPPPSVFNSLFSSKKGKTKKAHSKSPSQLPPFSIASEKPKPDSETLNHHSKPRDLPEIVEKSISFNDEEFFDSRIGGDSPLHPIPPPPPPPLPPPPPPYWKFAANGDSISSRSHSSSPRAASPDLDEIEATIERNPLSSGSLLVKEAETLMFCSSPDVNSKADNFIARFRADLKLQKMNSIKEKKARKRSNLGREPSPGPE